jgi:hypothetical protein
MGPPVDDDAREAQEHLKKYLEYARNIEASTHSLQTAQRRYEERVQNYRIARNGSYSVIESYGTAKNDASPPTDFDPWSHDEDAREGKRCVFEANGELLCR